MRNVVVRENDRVGSWVEANGGGFYRAGSQCIGLEQDGRLIAGVLFDYWNGASIYAHVAVNGLLTREFVRVVFDYAFRQLGCKVIIGLVPASNKRARRFDEHLGFKLKAEIPEGHPDGSLLIYAMRKHECRWLESKHGQTVRTAAA